MNSPSLPSWSFWLMGLGLAGFVLLFLQMIRRNKGIRRSFYAWPYTLWMIISTIVPLILIGYYALTDKSGQFTLENFANFWDSNRGMKNELIAQGFDPQALGMGARGMVNVDTLVYSLWMAFLCTGISFLVGYPAALIMADREFKLGATIVVLFIIPMWMNFLLRTIAWMSLLEDNGLINTVLQSLGFGKAKLMYNSQAVLLGMVYNYLPYMILPLYTIMVKIDDSLIEAAQDLGAGRVHTLTKVLLPLSVPGITTGITMVFVPSISTFIISRMLGGGSNLLIGDLIELQFLGNSYNYNLGSAMSLVLMVVVLLCMSFTNQLDNENKEGGVV
ncbi:Spermidine/putrescine transport system permease protein PotB [bioreactor metagenome]|uniref:Spermidine/putrescine transport system permease protein PotB n=1 Tax=bioreactor metagenome TaxID=1076179 RepID=A0A644ZDM9_9ZZZZ